MSQSPEEFIARRVEQYGGVPVPEHLHSVEREAPFRRCTICDKPLEALTYQIMKSYEGRECVFEVAICEACSEGLRAAYSEASREVMEASWGDVTRVAPHAPGDACDFCGESRTPGADGEVQACCVGDVLLFVFHRCRHCTEALHERLSAQTREEWGRFRSEHFPGPPSLEQPVEVAGA